MVLGKHIMVLQVATDFSDNLVNFRANISEPPYKEGKKGCEDLCWIEFTYLFEDNDV